MITIFGIQKSRRHMEISKRNVVISNSAICSHRLAIRFLEKKKPIPPLELQLVPSIYGMFKPRERIAIARERVVKIDKTNKSIRYRFTFEKKNPKSLQDFHINNLRDTLSKEWL